MSQPTPTDQLREQAVTALTKHIDAKASINILITTATNGYLSVLSKTNRLTPAIIETDLLTHITKQIQLKNEKTSDKTARHTIPKRLDNYQIATILLKLYHIYRLTPDENSISSEYDTIVVYVEKEGIYTNDESIISKLIRAYNCQATINDVKEIFDILKDYTERRARCSDEDLIAVNNGIFNYKTKTLSPFTADKIFLTKTTTDYNPNAKNVIIHNDDDGTDWDIESWMSSLSDDPEIVNVLWEILSAIIRPNVYWNKSAWLFSKTGNNGKGTLCALMRNLCGDAHTSIPLSDFGKEFMLEPLIRASAIIVDENDVGTYIDKAANIKAVVTKDIITINRKYKSPMAYRFFGFMVQCLNEFPKIKDKSNSFYRRQLFVPMDKCFTGRERKYIKTDYIRRKTVLEYVLFRILSGTFYNLSTPKQCINVLNDYKEHNDPVLSFWKDIETALVWDFVPFTYIFELYKSWMQINHSSMKPLGRNYFLDDLLVCVNDSTEKIWECNDSKQKIRIKNALSKPEPLTFEYNILSLPWRDIAYKGDDINRLCTPTCSPDKAMTGLTRRKPNQ